MHLKANGSLYNIYLHWPRHHSRLVWVSILTRSMISHRLTSSSRFVFQVRLTPNILFIDDQTVSVYYQRAGWRWQYRVLLIWQFFSDSFAHFGNS